jgi:hypothetical protein
MTTSTSDRFQAIIKAMPLKSLLDIDRLLIAVDYCEQKSQTHTALVGSTVARIMRKCSHVTLPYLESRYRYFTSDTYLIAVPATSAPKNMVPKLIQTRQVAKYFLWICINGRPEAEETLSRFDLYYDSNAQRLGEAGFLFKKPTESLGVGLPQAATPGPSFAS